MPVADHRDVHAASRHRVRERQRQPMTDDRADDRQVDRLGKVNAPEAGGRDHHQRVHILAHPLCQPRGNGAPSECPTSVKW